MRRGDGRISKKETKQATVLLRVVIQSKRAGIPLTGASDFKLLLLHGAGRDVSGFWPRSRRSFY